MRRRWGLGLLATGLVVGGAARMGVKSARRSRAAAERNGAAGAPGADLEAQAEPDRAAELHRSQR